MLRIRKKQRDAWGVESDKLEILIKKKILNMFLLKQDPGE